MAVLLREKFWLLTWKSIAQNVTPKPLDSLEEQNSKKQWQSKICSGRFLARLKRESSKGKSALKLHRKRPTCWACGLVLGSSPLAAVGLAGHLGQRGIDSCKPSRGAVIFGRR